MNKLTKFIKKKIYRKTQYEYWVNIKDIEIQNNFQKHKPHGSKLYKKYNWYLKHGTFQSPIILNRDFVLIDGYTSYLIAEKCKLGKVPVYFVN